MFTLEKLREANEKRAPLWRKDSPETCELFCAVELGGEVGEVMNEVKKLNRAKQGLVGGKEDEEGLKEEIGDVLICLDLLCMKFDYNLGELAAKKFNKTSEKYGFDVFIEE